MKLLIIQSLPASCHFLPLRSKYSPQHPQSIYTLITSIFYIVYHMMNNIGINDKENMI